MQTLTHAITAKFGDKALTKIRSAVTTARAGVRARQTRVPHKTYTLVGGPYDNAVIDLSDPATGIFVVGDVRGRYADQWRLPEPAAAYARKYIAHHKDLLYGAAKAYLKPSPLILFWETR